MGGFSFDPFRFEDFSGFYSGEDYSDPLGYNRFLLAEEEKRKREEEERRRRLSTFGGRVGEYLSPLLQDSPSFSEAVGKVMSIPKMLLSDIPVSELSGLPEILPSQEVLANALFPKRLPGDDPGKRFQTLPSGASIPVDISPEEADISTGLLRGGTKAAGAFGLDPSFPFSFGKGALSSLLGGYFGYQGIKGGSEQIGKGLSELDSLERAKAAESISEGLGSLGMGTMALSGLKHSIPDYSVGGGYRLSSPIHLKPSFDRAFKTPVFGTPIHEGGITGSAVDSVFGPDPILDRAAELLGSDNALKDVPVPNYRGSTPAERVTAYHGTPDVSWALGQGKNYKPQLQETISLLEQTWMDNPEIRQRHPKFRSYAEEALGPDIYEPKNPVFSTRMANPDNLYGGPIYLSESPTYVEGMYSDAETGGPRPGIVETEVNLGKNLDLDAPVPRDIKVRGLAVIGEAIRNAANDQQKAHFQRRYEELKRPDITGREAQRVVGDVLDLATAEGIGPTQYAKPDISGKSILDEGIYIDRDENIPLQRRLEVTGKDLFNRMIERDLGYSSLKHNYSTTLGDISDATTYIPFSRSQVKVKGVTELPEFKNRSTEGLIEEYYHLDPTKESDAPLLDALSRELKERYLANKGKLNPPEDLALLEQFDKGEIEPTKYFQKPEFSPEELELIRPEAERLTPSQRSSQFVPEKPFLKSSNNPEFLLERILRNSDLTRFNEGTLRDFLVKNGVDIDSTNLGTILQGMVNRGVINKKATGTYTLNKYVSSGVRKTAPGTTKNLEEALLQSLEPVQESLKNPTVRVSEPGPVEGKPIELGDMIGDLARDLGWKPDPFDPSTRMSSSTDIKKTLENMFKSKYGENWQNQLSPDEQILVNDIIRGEVSPKGQEIINKLLGKKGPLTQDEIRAKQQALLDSDPDIRAVQEAMMAKPVKPVDEGTPEKPPSDEAGGIGEPGEEKAPKKTFLVTLDDGSVHKVKATDPDSARDFAQNILDENMSEKVIQDVKVLPDSLTRAAQTRFSERDVKMQDQLLVEQAKEEIKDLKAREKSLNDEEKARVKLLDRIIKAQDAEDLKLYREGERFNQKVQRVAQITKEKELRQREKAHEKEIKDQLKAEDAFRKAEEKALRESEKKAKREKNRLLKEKEKAEGGILNNPIVKALNAAKSLAYGGDVGHLLRQGKQMNVDLLFSKHAKKVLEQVPVIFKSMKSEDYFNRFHDNLKADPDIKRMVDDFGLDMPGLGKGLKEEVFHGGGLAEELPGIGKYYAKPSERAYTAGLNFLRAAEVKKLIQDLNKRGFTYENAPEKFKGIARAINIISQRGDFNPAYQKLFSDASVVFGAPRAKAARIQNLAELFKSGESGATVRKTAAKMMLFNTVMFGMLKAKYGEELEFIDDPRRTDAGKFRVRNVTIDPWVGLGTTGRTISKLVTGESKSPYTGKSYKVSPEQAIGREFLGMLSPGVTLLWELFSGKGTSGFEQSRLKAFGNLVPLSWRQIKEIMSEEGLDSLLMMLQTAGEGIDTFNYEEAKKEQERLKRERGKATTSGRKKQSPYPF